MAFNTDDQDVLGFETLQGKDTNLFELFAKGETDLTATPSTDPKPKDDTSTTPEPVKPAASTSKEPVVDTDKLKEMMLNDLKGETVDTTNDKTDTTTSTKDEGIEKKDPEPELNAISIVFNDFKEKGLFDLPEDFAFDGTEEGLQSALELTVQNRLAAEVEATINDAFSKRPEQAEVAQDLIRFLGVGGKIADFQTAYSDAGIKAEDLDSDDEAVRTTAAKRTLTSYYKDIMKWDDAKIKRQIDRSVTKGTDVLVDEAKDFLEEYNTHKAAQRKQLLDSTVTADKTRKDANLAFNTQLVAAIEKDEEIGGFKLKDKKERQALHDYMFKPTIEINGKKVPQYLADRQRLQSEPKLMLAQALFLKNGMKPDTTATVTKVTTSLEKKLSDMQKGKKTSAASGQGIENKDRSTPGILDFEHLEVMSI